MTSATTAQCFLVEESASQRAVVIAGNVVSGPPVPGAVACCVEGALRAVLGELYG